MKRIALLSFLFLAVFAASCGNKKKLTKQQKNDLEVTYLTLKNDLEGGDVKMDGDRVLVTLNEGVLFNVNSSEINKSYLPTLEKMAIVLNKYPKTNVLISGYTDTTGTEELNLKLSKERADAASNFLQKKGVAESRLYTWGLGSRNPIADNKTEVGRAKNRRVQFVILYNYNADEK